MSRRWINTLVLYDAAGNVIRREGYWYDGPIAEVGGGPMVTFEQDSYAFYADGTESGSSIIGSADTQQTLTVDTNYQCRIRVTETGGAAGELRTIDFQYNHAGGGYVDVGASTPLQYVDSTNLTNGDDTTQRLSGGGTFVTPNAGVTEDNTIPNLTYGASEECEFLLSFTIDSAQVSHGDEILVAIQGVDTLTLAADIDVNKPSSRRRVNVT